MISVDTHGDHMRVGTVIPAVWHVPGAQVGCELSTATPLWGGEEAECTHSWEITSWCEHGNCLSKGQGPGESEPGVLDKGRAISQMRLPRDGQVQAGKQQVFWQKGQPVGRLTPRAPKSGCSWAILSSLLSSLSSSACRQQEGSFLRGRVLCP